MRTVESHLTKAVLQRLGRPDTTLCLGACRFPVHSTYVSACSGVLGNLLSDCQSLGELRLLAGSGGGGSGGDGTQTNVAGNDVPPAIKSEQHFELFLRQMYSGSGAIGSEEQALALLSLADYWHCPLVAPAADAYLATALWAGELGAVSFTDETEITPRGDDRFRCSRDDAKVVRFLELASQHKLRRLMSACLPLVLSLNHPAVSAAAIRQLDQVVLATLLVDMRQHGMGIKYGCDDRDTCEGEKHTFTPPPTCSAGLCCKECREKMELGWRKCSERIEKALLAAGWGDA